MVERIPEIEVLLPVSPDRPASVTWNGDPVEADEVTVDEDGKVRVTIGGTVYDDTNSDMTVRQDHI